MKGRPIEILLAEDSPGDVRLTQEAFREARVLNNLHIVGDGEEAMAFLRHEGKYASTPGPDIILLDLNMPKKDGRETLAEIKADDKLKYIPVVIMTISKSEEDIFRRRFLVHYRETAQEGVKWKKRSKYCWLRTIPAMQG